MRSMPVCIGISGAGEQPTQKLADIAAELLKGIWFPVVGHWMLDYVVLGSEAAALLCG